MGRGKSIHSVTITLRISCDLDTLAQQASYVAGLKKSALMRLGIKNVCEDILGVDASEVLTESWIDRDEK